MGARSLVVGEDQLAHIMGMVNLVGAGQLDAHSAQQAIATAVQARNSALVEESDPTKARRWPLGFTPTTITAATVATLSTQPQILFRPERLVIPSDFAGGLSISAIIVGQASQLAAQAQLPGRTYTEFGVGVDMHLDTADVSQFVQLGLSNNSGHDIPFYGQFIGLIAM